MRDGYCYLSLFAAVTMGRPKCHRILKGLRRELGAYPKIRVVLVRLLQMTEVDVVLPGVLPVGCARLHVDMAARPQTLSDLVCVYMFSSATIGGSITDEMIERTENINQFADLCNIAGLPVNDAFAEAARRLTSRYTTTNTDLVKGMVTKRTRTGADRYNVKYALDALATARLSSEYSELDIVAGNVSHPHGYCAAATLCQEELMLRRFAYDRKRSVPKGYDAAIVDIGANYYRHARQGRFTIHCCTPIMTHRDSSRDTTREHALYKLVNDKVLTEKTAQLYVGGSSTLQRCYHPAQHCGVKAPCGMMVHSQYDITMTQLGEIFDSHELEQVMSVVLFDVGMLYKDNGLIPGHNMIYRRDGEDLVCGFMGDSSVSYRHKLANIQDIMRTTIVTTPKGRVYYCEKTVRGGAVMLHYVHCRRRPMVLDEAVDFSLWYPPDKSTVLLVTFDFDSSVFGDSKLRTRANPVVRFKRRFLEVDARFFELTYSHCVKSGDKSFNLNECFSAAATFNSRMCINGNDIRAMNRVNSEDLLAAVVCIYCIAYRQRWSAGKSIEAFTKSEKERRAKGKLNFVEFFKCSWKCVTSGIVFDKFAEGWNTLVDTMAAYAEWDELSADFLESVREVNVSEFLTVSGEYDDNDVRSLLMDLNVSSFSARMEEERITEVTEVIRGRVPRGAETSGTPQQVDTLKSTSGVSDCDSVSISDTIRSSMDDLSSETASLNLKPIQPIESALVDAVIMDAEASRSKKKARKFITSMHILGMAKTDDNGRRLKKVRKDASTFSCDADLTRKHTPADGHCLFHALGETWGVTALAMRELLAENAPADYDTTHLRIVDGSRDGWGKIEDQVIFSKMTGIRVCTHLRSPHACFTTDAYSAELPEDAKVCHLLWSVDGDPSDASYSAHVDLLVEAGTCKAPTISNEPDSGHDSLEFWSCGTLPSTAVVTTLEEVTEVTEVETMSSGVCSDTTSQSSGTVQDGMDMFHTTLPKALVAHVHIDDDGSIGWDAVFAEARKRKNRDVFGNIDRMGYLPDRRAYELDDILRYIRTLTDDRVDVLPDGGRKYNRLLDFWDAKGGKLRVYMEPKRVKGQIIPNMTVWRVPAAEAERIIACQFVHCYRSAVTAYNDDAVYVMNGLGDPDCVVWRVDTLRSVKTAFEENFARYPESLIGQIMSNGYSEEVRRRIAAIRTCTSHTEVRLDCTFCVYTDAHPKLTAEFVEKLLSALEKVKGRVSRPSPLKPSHTVVAKQVGKYTKAQVGYSRDGSLKGVDHRPGKLVSVVDTSAAAKKLSEVGKHRYTSDIATVGTTVYGVSGHSRLSARGERGGVTKLTTSASEKSLKPVAVREVSYVDVVIQPRRRLRNVMCGTTSSTVFVSDTFNQDKRHKTVSVCTISTQTDSEAIPHVRAVGSSGDPREPPASSTGGQVSPTVTFTSVVSVDSSGSRTNSGSSSNSVVSKTTGSTDQQEKRGFFDMFSKKKKKQPSTIKEITLAEIASLVPTQATSAGQLAMHQWWVSFPFALRVHIYVCTVHSNGDMHVTMQYAHTNKTGATVSAKYLRKNYVRISGAVAGWWRVWSDAGVDHYDILIADTYLPCDGLRRVLQALPENAMRVSVDFSESCNHITLIGVLTECNRKVLLVDSRTGGTSFAAAVEAMHPRVFAPPAPTEKPMVTFPKLGAEDIGKVRDPELLPGDTREVAYRNAMLEFKHLTANADNFNAAKYRAMLFASKNGMTPDVLDQLRRGQMNIFDNQLKQYVLTDRLRKYSHGYAMEGYVPFNEKNTRFNTAERYVVVGRSTERMLNQLIMEQLSQVSLEHVYMPRIEWTNGPPGCGKTYYIIQNARLPLTPAEDPIDLILCMTLEGRQDVSGKMKIKFPTISDEVLRRDIRTVASVLVNTCTAQYQRVMMDEALMAHAGTIGYVTHFASARSVLIIGDIHQIPYVDREHMCSVRCHEPSRFADITRKLNRTYRCPVDVTYALSDFYEGLHTTNGIVLSVRRRSYSADVTEVDKVAPNTLFLVHLQADKDALLSEGYGKGDGSKVLTVHESQGLTFDRVVCMRKNSKPLEIFSSVPYAIVAISRHRKSFEYYTDADDAITKFVQRAQLLDVATLRTWNQKRYASNLSAGGVFRGPLVLQHIDCHTEENLTVNLPASTHLNLMPVVDQGISLALKEKPKLTGVWEEDVSYLQMWYDDKLPGAAAIDNSHVQEWMEIEDTYLAVEAITIDPGKGIMRSSRFGKLRPVLRTFMFPVKRPSQKESLLGAVKRNLNAPRLANDDLDADCIGTALFKNFILSAIPSHNMAVLDALWKDTVSISSHLVERWIQKQPPNVRKMINSEVPLHLRRFNSFDYMIKGAVKPQLELSALQKYPSVQTIVYSDKTINAIFCPVFGVLFERLTALLDEKILIFSGLSPHEFEKELNARLAGLDLSEVVTVEEDMSKYDKAQARALRVFEDQLWEALGMDPYLLQMWTDSHVRSRVRDRNNGIYFDTEYQRKSGDATTFAGNTLVILAVLLAVYDIDDIALIMVAGDDSYIFFKPGCAHLPDPSRRIADLFNLECKLLRGYDTPYFCSKFLIRTPTWVYVVPDPLKFVTKLGRLDMTNYKHVEEYRVSCADTMNALFNPAIAEGLSYAVHERYGGRISDVSKLINVLRSICSSPQKFADLFVHDYGVRLCFDPSTKKLN